MCTFLLFVYFATAAPTTVFVLPAVILIPYAFWRLIICDKVIFRFEWRCGLLFCFTTTILLVETWAALYGTRIGASCGAVFSLLAVMMLEDIRIRLAVQRFNPISRLWGHRRF